MVRRTRNVAGRPRGAATWFSGQRPPTAVGGVCWRRQAAGAMRQASPAALPLAEQQLSSLALFASIRLLPHFLLVSPPQGGFIFVIDPPDRQPDGVGRVPACRRTKDPRAARRGVDQHDQLLRGDRRVPSHRPSHKRRDRPHSRGPGFVLAAGLPHRDPARRVDVVDQKRLTHSPFSNHARAVVARAWSAFPA